MGALGEYHSKEIHKREEGECGFHDLIVCSCGHCGQDGELQCEGKQYSTKHKLTCSYHHIAYRIECKRRAEDASAVIYPEMGRGHSNLCEANFTVLPEFRANDQSLCRLVIVTYYETIIVCNGLLLVKLWLTSIENANASAFRDLWAQVTLLRTPKSLMASKMLTCFISTNQLQSCDR